MNGPDHYHEAEHLLESLREVVLLNDGSSPEATLMLAEANVHALLAVAAATALTGSAATHYFTDEPELVAWHEVAGTEPETAAGEKVRLTDLESRLKGGESIRVFHPDLNDGDPVQLRDVMTYGDDIPEGRIGVFYSFTNDAGEDEYVKGLVPAATFVIPYGGAQ